MDDVDAGLLDGANVEDVGIQEMNHQHAKDIFVIQSAGAAMRGRQQSGSRRLVAPDAGE
jgi:hypothetical protein